MKTLTFDNTTRTYANIANMTKAVEKFLGENQQGVTMIVATDGARFSPAFILHADVVHIAQHIARNGWHVVGIGGSAMA